MSVGSRQGPAYNPPMVNSCKPQTPSPPFVLRPPSPLRPHLCTPPTVLQPQLSCQVFVYYNCVPTSGPLHLSAPCLESCPPELPGAGSFLSFKHHLLASLRAHITTGKYPSRSLELSSTQKLLSKCLLKEPAGILDMGGEGGGERESPPHTLLGVPAGRRVCREVPSRPCWGAPLRLGGCLTPRNSTSGVLPMVRPGAPDRTPGTRTPSPGLRESGETEASRKARPDPQ